MRCHEEWLVGADSECEDEDHTQRPDGEGLAVMTHREHVLIERSTDADVAFNGKHDDDPRRRKAKHVRQPAEHRANHCNTDIIQPTDQCSLKMTTSQQLLRWATWPQYDMGRTWGGCCAPFRGGAGFPCNTMSPVPRPASVPSGILIDPTVWPQYTNVTGRQTNRTDNGPIT